jgi:hypothetical protein
MPVAAHSSILTPDEFVTADWSVYVFDVVAVSTIPLTDDEVFASAIPTTIDCSAVALKDGEAKLVPAVALDAVTPVVAEIAISHTA